jgi:NTE family protein
MVLVDGGWTNAVPVGPARALGAEKVIAVDISRELEEIIEYKRGISLVLRSAMLTTKHLRELQLMHANVVLRPDVGHVHWADFSNPFDLIQRGRDAAFVSLDEIMALDKTSSALVPRNLGDRIRNIWQGRSGKEAK